MRRIDIDGDFDRRVREVSGLAGRVTARKESFYDWDYEDHGFSVYVDDEQVWPPESLPGYQNMDASGRVNFVDVCYGVQRNVLTLYDDDGDFARWYDGKATIDELKEEW